MMRDMDRGNRKNRRNKPSKLFLTLLMTVVFALLAIGTGCAGTGDQGSDATEGAAPAQQSAEEGSAANPNLVPHNNGYGTVFVVGTRIEQPADTSTSTVVDWSREKAAKAPADLQLTEKKHVVYSHTEITDGREKGDPLDLRMNLMIPKQDAEGKAVGPDNPCPVILLAPGGGFITCRIDNKYTEVQRYLVSQGYGVAIFEYHIIGQGRYMDAARDVWDAAKWMKKHGRDYGLNPDRLALIGNSAGGYVAALAACQGPAKDQKKDCPAFRCVVNFYGLSDLINNKADYEEAAIEAHHKPNSSDSQFVNGALSEKGLTDDPEEATKADPSMYIDGDEPPFLHLHGDADLWVSPSQSLHLHDALTAAGVPSKRYAVKGAAHADPAFRTKAAMKIVTDFLDRYEK